jgi:hypothetical protein
MNLTNPCDQSKAPVRQALEDAAVVGATAFVSGLIAVGGTPNLLMVYAVSLPALLVGLYSYGSARNIQNQPKG